MQFDLTTEIKDYEYIIDVLISQYGFDAVLSNPRKRTIKEWARTHRSKKGFFVGICEKYGKIYYNTGSTKFCIYFEEAKTILKFDYDIIDRLTWTRMRSNCCAIEAELYQKAKEEKVFFAFAPMCFAFSRQGRNRQIDFYMSRRCVQYKESAMPELHKKVLRAPRLIIKFNNDWYQQNPLPENDDYYQHLMFHYASLIWGDEFAICVQQFIHKYKIGDLHRGNWGSINGWPVIYDYGGFYLRKFAPIARYTKIE